MAAILNENLKLIFLDWFNDFSNSNEIMRNIEKLDINIKTWYIFFLNFRDECATKKRIRNESFRSVIYLCSSKIHKWVRKAVYIVHIATTQFEFIFCSKRNLTKKFNQKLSKLTLFDKNFIYSYFDQMFLKNRSFTK